MRHHRALYRADQVRALDEAAVKASLHPSYQLMVRAGQFVFDCLQAQWPECRAVTVFCGGGNNGGDGWVIARLAADAGMDVQVFWLKDPGTLSGDAQRAYADWRQCCGVDAEQPFAREATVSGELILDAIVGTGLSGPVRGLYKDCIERINQLDVPVIAVDIPSGLEADSGWSHHESGGVAIQATLTVSFIGRKRGCHTGEASRCMGRHVFTDLGVARAIYEGVTPDSDLMLPADLKQQLLSRRPDAHKGMLGSIAIIGGDEGMSGAPVLSGLAALRTGSGLVTVAGRRDTVSACWSNSPALMTREIMNANDLIPLLERVDVVAIGPGLGQSEWSRELLKAACEFRGGLVLDADALNLLAEGALAPEGEWIMTPHPGEAARLLGVGVRDVQCDRFQAARTLAHKYQAIVVLKGAGSIVADPQGQVSVCDRGTAAMASAGMGDALTGMIASLWGQGLSGLESAKAGVLVHALAGEQAAAHRRQILATDLIEKIPDVMPLSH